MRALILLSAAFLAFAAAVVQAEPVPELRVIAGAYVPTGDQADVLKGSMMIGTQVGLEAAEMIHVLGTFAYATPETDRPAIGKDVHIYQYDAGAEIFHVLSASRHNDHWTFRPFLGAGLGFRTYDFHDIDSGSETNFLGYGSLGMEFQHKSIALRVEGRDYVSRFKGLTGDEKSSTRNDLMFGAGLSFHL